VTIQAADYARVLMPVLVTLHRRRCQITAMSYAADGAGGCGHLELSLLSPRAHASCVPRWLANVIGVLRVDELS
jgi:hypothetical protein